MNYKIKIILNLFVPIVKVLTNKVKEEGQVILSHLSEEKIIIHQ
jgi:hypothetical protein